MSTQEILALEKIVNDETRPAEERRQAAEHIVKLSGSQAQTDSEESLIEKALRQVLDPVESAKAEAEYIATHRRCAVCLRHDKEGTAKCSLCGTEGGDWLPVTTQHPGWQPPYSKESLSNIKYGHTITTEHIEKLMNWREPDKQVNAAKFLPGEYVLSQELRDWCRQVLKWSGVSVRAEQPSQPVEAPETLAEPQPEPARIDTKLLKESYWAYLSWKTEREAHGLDATIAAFLSEGTTVR